MGGLDHQPVVIDAGDRYVAGRNEPQTLFSVDRHIWTRGRRCPARLAILFTNLWHIALYVFALDFTNLLIHLPRWPVIIVEMVKRLINPYWNLSGFLWAVFSS